MTIYIIITIMTISMALFVNNRYSLGDNKGERQQMCSRVILVGIFIILFMVSAGRIAVGNDYWEYKDIFGRISLNQHVSTEIGFNMVVKAVQLFLGTGQVAYLVIFAVFAFPTIYFMLKALNDQSDYFSYSFFLFMMGGYYFSSLNSVRYYLVLSIAFYAGKYAIRREWGRFILWILLASLFHKSVIIVLPLYWLATRNWRKQAIIFGLVGCVSFLLFPEFYRKIVFVFYPYYENSMFDTGTSSLTNIARCLGVFIFSLIYYKKAIQENKHNKFYFYLNLGALILYVFCSFIPEISRIGYYLNLSNIILIPNILIRIDNRKEKLFWSFTIGSAFFFYFVLFLYKAMDVSIRIVPYRSWIFE